MGDMASKYPATWTTFQSGDIRHYTSICTYMVHLVGLRGLQDLGDDTSADYRDG